jgi:tRNA(fMet)-specific endonuclease VapC
MRFLLETNVLSDLVRQPRGRIAARIAEVGEQHICTSIIAAAQLRYGAAKKSSSRLSAQLEAILDAIDVLVLESPVDSVYGGLRARLERAGRSVGLLIAAHALALGHAVVTDNEREFSRIDDLRIENVAMIFDGAERGNAPILLGAACAEEHPSSRCC